MNFKVLCSDLDGTLLSTKNDVSDFTISEIQRIKEHMRIILVSARMPKSMTYLQNRMGIETNPIICYNGALILLKDRVLHNATISMEKTWELFRVSQSNNIKLGLYHENEWSVTESSERVEKEIFNTKANPIFETTQTTLNRWDKNHKAPHKIMLIGTKEEMDLMTQSLQNGFASEMSFYRSNDTLIEVAPRSVSKLLGIKKLLGRNESLQDIVAFGDNYNDIEMLQKVGLGVAVSNARKEVKQIADKITLSNKEHGVAQFIKDHL